jgi:hypothetical protein
MLFAVAFSASGARADAAAGSVEAKLRRQGKHWVRAEGEIAPGAYVEDLLAGRANQPAGRGDLGKVVSLASGDDGQRDALVDFGRGYSVGIHLSELALVRIVSGGAVAVSPVVHHGPRCGTVGRGSGSPAVHEGPVAASADAAADSVEGQLRAQGKHLARTSGEITVGAYVQDTLVGRANQPAGRGNIGRVVALANGDAKVDFGRGHSIGIHLSELALVSVVSE